MKRREFITLLGGATAWPLAARAQTGKLVRLGYLDGGARTDPTTQNLRRQFVLGMRDLGYNEGRDYLLEERYAAGQLDSFPAYAHELVELPVDMIVAGGEAAIRAAKRATSQIPIVMTLAADPVGSGLVPNLAHPGGNLTGMSALASDLASKRVELLKELVPKAKRVAVLWNPSNQSKVTEWKDAPPPQVSPAGAVACKATHNRELAEFRHHGQSVGEGKFANLLPEREREGFRERDHRIRPLPPDRRERWVELGGRLRLDRHQNKTDRLRRDLGARAASAARRCRAPWRS
jgi:hypothetical protein